MIVNEPIINKEKGEKYIFNSNKNERLLSFKKNDPKYEAILEKFDKFDTEEEGEEFTIEKFLDEKAVMCEKCGIISPEKRFPDIKLKDNDKMTFREMYLGMYNKYEFPLRSLYENRCIAQCPNGFTDIAGYC